MAGTVSAVVSSLKVSFDAIRGVNNNMDSNVDTADVQLKLVLLEGWYQFGKVLRIKGETHLFNEITMTLIQFFYDVEDELDKKKVVSWRKMIGRFCKGVLRSLGFHCRQDLAALQTELTPILVEWRSAIERAQVTTLEHSDLNSDVIRLVGYLSVFPDGYKFNADELVHLWVGECFVQLNDMAPLLKNIEEAHFNELRERSILEPLEDSKYKLKDSDRSFARCAAANTCLHLDQGLISLPLLNDKIRHLSLSRDLNDKVRSKLEKIKLKLRTLLLSLGVSSETSDKDKVAADVKKNLMKIQKRLKRLRVLSLRHTSVQDLPSFISKLQHLRYLDVSFTPLKTLPSDLYALQILKIKRIEKHLKRFPKDFTELTNLIYVDWDESFLRKHKQPCHMGKLSRLENLPLFQIGQTDGYRISELETMNFLQGSICIENLHHVNDENEAKDAKLDLKCGLTKIQLKWIRGSIEGCAYDEVLRGLRPHENVTELVITYYRGNDLPGWISDCNLMKVQLMECSSCYFPALGKMKNLKTLVLDDMESISQISCRSDDDNDPEVVRFPSLESMELHNMTQLQEWTGLLENDRPLLRQIKVDNCHPSCRNGIRDAFPRASISRL